MLVGFLALSLGLLGYLAAALVTARVAYGMERARIIEVERDWHADEDPVQRFREQGQSSAALTGFLYGLAWPLVVPTYFFYRCAALVITRRPPPTPYERARRAERLDTRIRELEESLGLRGRALDENGPLS
ncbi:hypothetical protein F0L17_22225 [Streptomyces sp. TRM43335]|uniref:Uncharacterized protein n=1 Tax=Streptomyces taklimakanensis TaxID=2569853 RepID=A0A6G2BIR6_9ACTN|nr:hypothetical protein [Streptomyces taklimakanensis]MTE21782.1 hypothetical protein [Streptomyces taklimakanensis]